jgi:hypothetical protein
MDKAIFWLRHLMDILIFYSLFYYYQQPGLKSERHEYYICTFIIVSFGLFRGRNSIELKRIMGHLFSFLQTGQFHYHYTHIAVHRNLLFTYHISRVHSRSGRAVLQDHYHADLAHRRSLWTPITERGPVIVTGPHTDWQISHMLLQFMVPLRDAVTANSVTHK